MSLYQRILCAAVLTLSAWVRQAGQLAGADDAECVGHGAMKRRTITPGKDNHHVLPGTRRA